MPLGTEVDLGPSDIVLDGNPTRPQRGRGTVPPILAHVLWPDSCINQGATWYWVGLGPGHIVLHDDPAPP